MLGSAAATSTSNTLGQTSDNATNNTVHETKRLTDERDCFARLHEEAPKAHRKLPVKLVLAH